jgi:predicted transcriptional regulator
MNHDDIELGEIIEVERRPRAGVVVSVRLSPTEADALQAIAEHRDLTLSQVAREAIRAYLAQEQRERNPVVGAWTIAASEQGSIELVYGAHGAMVRTVGSNPTPAQTTHPPAP